MSEQGTEFEHVTTQTAIAFLLNQVELNMAQYNHLMTCAQCRRSMMEAAFRESPVEGARQSNGE